MGTTCWHNASGRRVDRTALAALARCAQPRLLGRACGCVLTIHQGRDVRSLAAHGRELGRRLSWSRVARRLQATGFLRHEATSYGGPARVLRLVPGCASLHSSRPRLRHASGHGRRGGLLAVAVHRRLPLRRVLRDDAPSESRCDVPQPHPAPSQRRWPRWRASMACLVPCESFRPSSDIAQRACVQPCVVDDRDAMAALEGLLEGCPPAAFRLPLFVIGGAAAFRTRFVAPLNSTDRGHFNYTTTPLRPGGALHAFAASGSSAADNMYRGRWSAPKTSSHYLQEGFAVLATAFIDKASADMIKELASPWPEVAAALFAFTDPSGRLMSANTLCSPRGRCCSVTLHVRRPLLQRCALGAAMCHRRGQHRPGPHQRELWRSSPSLLRCCRWSSCFRPTPGGAVETLVGLVILRPVRADA